MGETHVNLRRSWGEGRNGRRVVSTQYSFLRGRVARRANRAWRGAIGARSGRKDDVVLGRDLPSRHAGTAKSERRVPSGRPFKGGRLRLFLPLRHKDPRQPGRGPGSSGCRRPGCGHPPDRGPVIFIGEG